MRDGDLRRREPRRWSLPPACPALDVDVDVDAFAFAFPFLGFPPCTVGDWAELRSLHACVRGFSWVYSPVLSEQCGMMTIGSDGRRSEASSA